MRRLCDRLFILYAIVIFAFLFIPIIAMVLFSFNDSRLTAQWQGFTTKWYHELFGKSGIWTAFYNSVLVAVVVTILSALLGTATAMAMSRYDFRGKSAFEGYLYVPIIIPEITEALSILLLYMWVGIPLSILTVVVGHLTFTIPFAAIVIRSRLAGYDRSYEEAAQSLGADELQTFFRVTLPLIAPGVIAGSLLAFTLSYDDFVKTAFTRGPGVEMLPTTIYNLARKGGVTPELNALATIALSVSLVFAFMWQRFASK